MMKSMLNKRCLLRKLIALTLTFALLVPCCLPLAALAASYPYDTVSMDDVNLRSRANTTSTILKRIKAGDVLTILGASGSFYRVRFDGSTGYAMKKYVDGLDPSPDPTPNASVTFSPPAAVTAYPYDTTVIGKVKMRKTAKTNGEVVRTLLADSIVTVYSLTDNGFAKVKYEKQSGYVLSSYVNLAAIPTPTPRPTATPVPGSENYSEVKKGNTGVVVRQLQEALIELGYLEGHADGNFGQETETALKLFEKRNGLTQDGVADAELQLLLYEGTPKDKRGYRQYVNAVSPVPGATIKENGTGEPVERLQLRLKELGYYTPAVSGVCDTATIAAIAAFELKHNLAQDGLATASDQAILYGAAAMPASAVVTPTPTLTPAPPARTLRSGDKGEDVKTIQQRLTYLGYYSAAITGVYDNATIAAVRVFQNKSMLTVDGVCGPQTCTVLFGAYAAMAYATPAPTSLPSATAAPIASYPPITEENVVIIRLGTRGDAVLYLQTRLQELGYYTSRLDGVYLTDDIAAVRQFQKKNALTVDGTAGYNTQVKLYAADAVGMNTPAASPSAATLRLGSTGDAVIALQNRLIVLQYLSGTADGQYGLSTKTAVIAFQKANNLKADGIAGTATLAAINSTSAIASTASASILLKVGSVGDAVISLQKRLILLGYLTGSADGRFGMKTSLAVIAFQRKNGLTADGIAGKDTLAKLNNDSAVTAGGAVLAPAVTPVPAAPGTAAVRAGDVIYANWYTDVKAKCRKYPNVTVYDFTTGISWKLNMFSLGAHADCEPLTAEDTENMNKAFGKTTWNPKAVWVIFSDGSVYMGSTHNTPHGTQHNKNNNFSGHLCVHFPRTQAQVESIGPYATSHQKAIDLGWEATQKRAGRE